MTRTYAAIDVETTGLDPTSDAIIEIAIIQFSDGEILGEWTSLVDPGRPLPSFISQLTGITQDMVTDAPSLFSLRAQIRRQLADHILVGHNVGFDMGFLEEGHIGVGQHRIDTVTLASILIPEAGSFSLGNLAFALDLPGAAEGQWHRALSDARQTVALFGILQERAAQLGFAQLSEIVAAGRNINWPETVFFEEALRAIGQDAFGEAGTVRRLFKAPRLDGHSLNPRDELVPLDVELIEGMLRPEGNFSRLFPDYEYREQQVQMAAAVAEAFNDGRHLIVEAGTGTGKSLAYLLPAAFWSQQNERCVVVSTNTINLQDQLIGKDLPRIRALLPFELHASVLKGKRNYLCTRLFQQMRHTGPASADEMILFARLLAWLPNTTTGDVNEIALRTTGEQIAWARLSADNDSCRMDTCREERCPLHVARRRAEQAHILIVNHSLLLADVAAGNRVLPPYRDLIVDEAHHLEAAVTDGLSFHADRRYLETLLEDVVRPRSGLVADLQARARASLPPEIAQTIDEFAQKLRGAGQQASVRAEGFFATLDFFLQDHIGGQGPYAEQIRLVSAIRTQPGWDEVEISWENLNVHLKSIVDGLARLVGGVEEVLISYDIDDGEDLQAALESLGRGLADVRQNLHSIISEPSAEMIYWAEIFRGRVSLHAAPLHVGPLVEEHIFNTKETVILTSATLRTAGRGGYGDVSFDYLSDRLHAFDAGELAVGSPFDYESNTLLYLISDMPEPNQPGYQRYVEEAILAVARALGGRTMVLFTSYGQLRATGHAIAGPLTEAEIDLLMQGEGLSRQQLLTQFSAPDRRAVLMGTRSFWEGVDVPGTALQAVVIARLPFDVPSDPIFAARSETFESPFFEYSIPEAVLRFRQGFGRLIRRRDDEGLVVILDKRVLTKRYGQAFLDALPDCTVIRQRHDRLAELTERWFRRERAG